MKRSTILLSLLLITAYSYSQCNLLNPSFENTTTTNYGSGSITHPTDYNPFISVLLSIFSGGLPGVNSSMDAQSGNLSLELFKDTANGFPVGGDAMMVMPCNNFVSSVDGFYKMTNTLGDTAGVVFIATEYNTSTQMRDTVGVGVINFFSNQLNYSSFSINPVYPSLNVSPDTITIWAFYFANTDLSSFKIDNLSLNYLAVGLEDQKAKEAFNIFPNPAKESVSLNAGEYRGERFQLIDLHGKVMLDRRLTEATETIDLSQFAAGIYLLKVGKLSEKLIIE